MRRRLRYRIARGFAAALIVCVTLSVLCVLALRFVDPPTTAFMLADRLDVADQRPALRFAWVDRQAISANAQLAVIAAEDQRFVEHFGFDLTQIAASIGEARDGRKLRGASTITQQVAKNLFLWQGQSVIRKGLEAYFTVLLELLWPKRRILEVYLNVAQFGRGVYGVGAASERFYRKSAAQLSRTESALLAAVLPSPQRFRVEAPSVYVRRRQAWILGQMIGIGGVGHLRRLD